LQVGHTSATRQGPDDDKTLKDMNFQVRKSNFLTKELETIKVACLLASS